MSANNTAGDKQQPLSAYVPLDGNSSPSKLERGMNSEGLALKTAPALHSFTAGGEACMMEKACYLLASL